MAAIDLGLRLIGAFYVFAGFVLASGALRSATLDAAIAAIELKSPALVERVKTWWSLLLSLLIFSGGVMLLAMLDLAAWLFVTAAIAQAVYLLAAPRLLDALDEPDARGRRQTTNAFFIYSAATLLVLWARHDGRLQPWQEAGWSIVAIVVAAIVALLAYMTTLWVRVRR
jgi:hypothetical protein